LLIVLVVSGLTLIATASHIIIEEIKAITKTNLLLFKS
jgi:hypothetical protein